MSTSPASCPGLDFIDGLLTPLVSPPEPRRARGAPWASRRPRPYVDKLISPYAAAVPNEVAVAQDAAFPPPQDDGRNYDCPSPPKRRNIQQSGHADASLYVKTTSNEQEKLLVKALFPELPETPLKDAKLPSPGPPQQPESAPVPRGQPIQRNRHIDCRSWLSTKNPHQTASNTPDLPPVLPVTPPRPVTYSTNHSTTTNKTTHTVQFKSVEITYRSARSYTTKNSNRSILRSAAMNTFEQITGMTTAARVEAAAAASKSVDSDTESDGIYPRRVEDEEAELPEEIDVFSGGKSKTGDPCKGEEVSSITRQSEPRHSTLENDMHQEPIQGNADHEYHSAPSHWSPEEHVYSDSRAVARDTTPSRQSIKSHRDPLNTFGISPGSVLSKSAASRIPSCLIAATTSTSLRSRHNAEPQSELEEKHEQYKQYVYERILPYPHRRDENLPRKGHKALAMGYLIPPPPANDNASQASNPSDEDSIQELKLRILGRTSQTDFRVLQNVEKKLREKMPVKEKKTRQKTRVCQEERDEAADVSGRKRLLSHLNVYSVMNKMIERELPPPLQEPREQDAKEIVGRPAGRKPKAVKDKQLEKKSKNKKVQLPKGHRPLQLQYVHAKKQPSATQESVNDDQQATLDNLAADRTDAPRLSCSPENVAAMQLLALEELHVGQEPHVGRDESPLVHNMQTPVETPRKSACKTVAGSVELAGPKSLGTRSNVDEMHAISQQIAEATPQPDSSPETQSELVHGSCPPGSNKEMTAQPAVSPLQHKACSRQSQPVVPPVKIHDICDAFMPISSLSEQRQSQDYSFTLRTTSTTRLAVGTVQQLLASRNFTLQEDLSSLPSDLWYDSGNRPEGEKGTSGHQIVPASMVECHNTLEQSTTVLAPDSSRMPYSPAKREQYTPPQTRRPGRASQCDWTPVGSASPDKPQARRPGGLFPESSYESMDGNGSAFPEDSTPPCPTKAILANITPSDHWHLRDYQDDEDPSPPSPESDLSPLQSVWSDAIPAPHQECRTPAPSDEYEDKTQIQVFTVPPDVEHEYQEALQEQRLRDRPPEIPALAPAPDSPEETTCDAESTLQTTLNRYGRRIVGFRPLAMRRRPPVNRSIPQETPLMGICQPAHLAKPSRGSG